MLPRVEKSTTFGIVLIIIISILYLLPRASYLRDDLVFLQANSKVDYLEDEDGDDLTPETPENNLDAAARLNNNFTLKEETITNDDYIESAADEAESNSKRMAPPLEGQNRAHSHVSSAANASETVAVPLTKAECYSTSRRRDKPGTPGTPIQFIHIPKAGGTTIQMALQRWTRGMPRYMKNGAHGTNWTCPGQISQGLLYGHRGFGFCDRFEKRYAERAFYIVAVREPVSHFRSLFDFMMYYLLHPGHPRYRLWANKDLSDLVVEYNHTLSLGLDASDHRMEGPKIFVNMAKQQTAFMCGWDCVDFHKFKVSDEMMLKNALKNLQRTDVVVKMENMNDMISQLRYHVDWMPSREVQFPHDNVVPYAKKSVLTEQAARIIAGWSTLDLELYEYVKKRHDQLTSVAKQCNPIIGA